MERDPDAKRQGYSAKSYLRTLEEGLLPHYDETRHFQQDNAGIHRAAVVEGWLQQKGISWIEWPAHSPDLNPIEHVWAALKRRMKRMFPNLWNLKKNEVDIEEFKRCIRLAWWDISQEYIDSLIDSMPRRLKAVKKARGWYTKY